MKGRYQSWGLFLKRNRERSFRSAREFCTRTQLGISYPQYSRYEAGDQLPSLDQALKMSEILGMPLLETVLEWNQAQTAQDSAREALRELLQKVRGNPGQSADTGASAPAGVPQSVGTGVVLNAGIKQSATKLLDDIIVLNRSHLKLFSSNPIYRDIFTFINSGSPEWVTLPDLCEALAIEPTLGLKLVTDLSESGVILLETVDGKVSCRSAKSNFYFPDDQDFFQLRNENLTHNVSRILGEIRLEQIQSRSAYRGLVTRELTRDQVRQLSERLEKLLSEMVELPETSDQDRIYSLCAVLGERFRRPRSEAESQPQPGTPFGLKRKGEAPVAALDPASL